MNEVARLPQRISEIQAIQTIRPDSPVWQTLRGLEELLNSGKERSNYMPVFSIARTAALVLVFATFGYSEDSAVKPYNQGVKSCQDCHKNVCDDWEESKHYTSYRKVKKDIRAGRYIGGKTDKKGQKDCGNCHFTVVQASPDARARAKSGPSCESCHGPSSVWEDMHYDYGGENIKKETETPEHKAKRIAESKAAGLIWSTTMKYDAATNCIKCHGMATPDVKVAALEKMVSGGHPVNTDFDIMGFYQDKIARKRWPARSDAELARVFVAGQAAKLVSATGAIKEATQEDYKAAQMKRAANAKAALDALKNIPEVAALLSSPSEDNALKLMAAVKKMDLSGKVKLR